MSHIRLYEVRTDSGQEFVADVQHAKGSVLYRDASVQRLASIVLSNLAYYNIRAIAIIATTDLEPGARMPMAKDTAAFERVLLDAERQKNAKRMVDTLCGRL